MKSNENGKVQDCFRSYVGFPSQISCWITTKKKRHSNDTVKVSHSSVFFSEEINDSKRYEGRHSVTYVLLQMLRQVIIFPFMSVPDTSCWQNTTHEMVVDYVFLLLQLKSLSLLDSDSSTTFFSTFLSWLFMKLLGQLPCNFGDKIQHGNTFISLCFIF